MLPPPYVYEPIGFARNSMKLKFDAPIQPGIDGISTIIELIEGKGFEHALKDLSGFDRIWLIWCFHRNDRWRPMVRPPRGPEKRRGLFATRSPHRPNPIGLSCVQLVSISGINLTIGPCDLVDGTPILDIKPYIPGIDSFPEAKYGWLNEIEEWEKSAPTYVVAVSAEAQSQLDWLTEQGVDIFQRAKLILERSPEPHRTRRIEKVGENLFRIGTGAWRIFYEVNAGTVQVVSVTPGYPAEALTGEALGSIPQREIQSSFLTLWGKR